MPNGRRQTTSRPATTDRSGSKGPAFIHSPASAHFPQRVRRTDGCVEREAALTPAFDRGGGAPRGLERSWPVKTFGEDPRLLDMLVLAAPGEARRRAALRRPFGAGRRPMLFRRARPQPSGNRVQKGSVRARWAGRCGQRLRSRPRSAPASPLRPRRIRFAGATTSSTLPLFADEKAGHRLPSLQESWPVRSSAPAPFGPSCR